MERPVSGWDYLPLKSQSLFTAHAEPDLPGYSIGTIVCVRSMMRKLIATGILFRRRWVMTNGRQHVWEPSFLPELVRGVRLGVVTVFGILVPGMWFWMTMSVSFVSITDEETLVHLLELPLPTNHPMVAWLMGFVLVYVIGCVLRAISPNALDANSIRCLRGKAFLKALPVRILSGLLRSVSKVDGVRILPVNSPKDSWLIQSRERFPYKSLPEYFEQMGVPGFIDFVPWGKEKSGKCSTVWVNTSKIWVSVRNAELGDFLWREEAFVRSLSGVGWATIVSSILSLFYLGISWLGLDSGYNPASIFAFVLVLFTNGCVLLGIVFNFHRQRLREVTKIVAAMHVLARDEPPYSTSNHANETE